MPRQGAMDNLAAMEAMIWVTMTSSDSIRQQSLDITRFLFWFPKGVTWQRAFDWSVTTLTNSLQIFMRV
jgi:hypothetical protein